MSEPLVSIVTPTLERAVLLEHTIRSLQAQSYRNFEHIVVDGGSGDGTVELLRRVEGSYPLRWISEPDGGMYDAINKGMALAGGEILAYLNSDDLYFPWTLEVVVAAFARQPGADVVYGDVLATDDARRSQRLLWQLPFDLDFVQRVGFLAQPAVFWRRAVLERHGPFDVSLRYVADCDWWMRIGQGARFARVAELIAIDRDHDSSLRQREMPALLVELNLVRSRYVTLHGPAHRLALLRHRVRTAIARRLYWLAFTFRSALPGLRREGPWHRFLSLPGVRVALGWALAIQVPILGPRIQYRVLGRSRYLPDDLA